MYAIVCKWEILLLSSGETQQLVLTVPANRTWQCDSNSFDIHSLLAVKTSVIIGDEAKWVHPHLFLQAIATEV